MNDYGKTCFLLIKLSAIGLSLWGIQLTVPVSVSASDNLAPKPEVLQDTSAAPPSESLPESSESKPTPLNVEDIVITGTWTPHTQKDSPIEIERIASKKLEQAGATNIRHVLQDVPAIELRRTGGRFQQFQMRGLDSIHTLLLVNGQELIGSTEGGQFTEDLLASPEIESIEVVKGSGAVQYGSDAIGGVINIRTRRATQPIGATAYGQYGRFNTITSFAAPEFRTSDGKFGGYVAAGVSKSDGFDYIKSTPMTNGDPEFTSKNVSGHLDYALTNSMSLSFYSRYTDNDRNSRGGATPTSTRTETTSANARSQSVLRFDWHPDTVSSLTVSGHYQNFENDSRTNTLSTGDLTRVSRFTQELWEPQFQYTRQIGEHHLLTVGGEHDIRRIRGQNFSRPTATTNLTESAGWVQDEIAVLPWIDIVLGSRYTTNSKAGGFWSPQTTLLLKPGNFRARFTYTRGFRSPSLSELGASFVEGGFFGIVGNSDLLPEKSSNYTANVEYYFERAKIGASLFRYDVDNLIRFVNGTCSPAESASLGVAPNFCTKPSNTAEVRSQGFEVEAGISPTDWLRVQTGYMYLDSVDRRTEEFLFGRSRHAWKTTATGTYDHWTLTARVRYFTEFGFADPNNNGRIDRNSSELAPANIQLDLRLAMLLKNGLEIYGGVDNATSSRVQVGGVFPPEGLPLWYFGMRMSL